VIGGGLGKNGCFYIYFSSDFLSTPITCSVTINNVNVASSCSFVNNIFIANISTNTKISSNTPIKINIEGINNPFNPKTYFFPIETYYDSTNNKSRVEYSNTAFNGTFTAITKFSISMSPTNFMVYTLSPVNL